MHRYAQLTAAMTFLLLVAGGLVTSTGSGLAVPDWPRSFGTWFPPMVGGVAYEHGHRMIAAVVALMILGLAVWLRAADPRRWMRGLGFSALAAVIAQALLGGLTVLWQLPPPVSIAHACLGQAVFCLVVCAAAGTSPRWDEAPGRPPRVAVPGLRSDSAGATQDSNVLARSDSTEHERPAGRGLGLTVAILAATQLLLGAVIRHTGYAVFIHMGGAFVLLACACWLAARVTPHTIRWGGLRLLGLIGTQIVLGLLVFTHRGSVAFRTAHVAVGALVLAQAVLLAWALARQNLRFRIRGPVPGAALGDLQ